MGSISRRAGMSTSSVYYHFPSKDSILLELLDRAAASLQDALIAVTRSSTRTGTARRLASAYVGWMAPDPRQAVLLLGTGVGGTAELEASRRRHNAALTRGVAHLLREDVRREDTDLLVAATALVVLFGELARVQADEALPEPDLLAAAEGLATRLIPPAVASAR